MANLASHRLGNSARAFVAVLALCVGVASCGEDGKREVRELRTQVQQAYGTKNFKKGLELSQKGLAAARAALGDKAPDTLYFVQAISENTMATGNMRATIAAIKQEIDMRAAAGQDEKKLQPRRTLLIKIAEESDDKLTAVEQAIEVSRGIDMKRGRDPQPVYRTPTNYPVEMYQQKIEGDVDIAYSLDQNGAVTEARVASATPARVFDQAALESFKQWRFTPMLDSNGRPISASGFKFTLAFRLARQ
ncbi:MAG: energy transducer TonB [Rhodospirillaceae bacterium]